MSHAIVLRHTFFAETLKKLIKINNSRREFLPTEAHLFHSKCEPFTMQECSPVSKDLMTFKVGNPDVYIKYPSFFPCRQLLWNFSELCVGQAKTYPYALWICLHPGFCEHSFLLYQSMIYSGVIWLLHLETKKHSWRISWVLSFKAPSKVEMKLQMLSGGTACGERRTFQV